MDNFKLDLTQLTPVEEKDRVKGNWYLVADRLGDYGTMVQHHSGDAAMDYTDGSLHCNWGLWFLIPPNLPGFPVAELPTMPVVGKEYEFDLGDIITEGILTGFEFYSEGDDIKFIAEKINLIRPIQSLPSFTIPSGTKAEQIEGVKKILEELETK